MRRNILVAALALAAVVGTLTACSSTASGSQESADPSEAQGTAAENQVEVQKVTIGIGNNAAPYFYVDESGELTGFNVEVWKAIDELLPEYEIAFDGLSYENVLVSLDAGRVDVADYCLYKTVDSEGKYIFTDPFMSFTEIIGVREDEQYSSIAEMAGKTISVIPGGSDVLWLEDYNASVPEEEQVNIVYSDGDNAQRYDDLINGRIDGYVAGYADINALNETFGGGLHASDIVVKADNCYYALLPENQELADAISGALAELFESGTYQNISQEWLGFDASPVAE